MIVETEGTLEQKKNKAFDRTKKLTNLLKELSDKA
jgi:hypothetical protein